MHAANTPAVGFGSTLAHAPRGTSQKADEAKTAMTYLKDDKVAKSGILMSEYPAGALKKKGLPGFRLWIFLIQRQLRCPHQRVHC